MTTLYIQVDTGAVYQLFNSLDKVETSNLKQLINSFLADLFNMPATFKNTKTHKIFNLSEDMELYTSIQNILSFDKTSVATKDVDYFDLVKNSFNFIEADSKLLKKAKKK